MLLLISIDSLDEVYTRARYEVEFPRNELLKNNRGKFPRKICPIFFFIEINEMTAIIVHALNEKMRNT